MIALIRAWLNRRQNLRCAAGRHHWIREKPRVYCTTVRCSNCGVSYRV